MDAISPDLTTERNRRLIAVAERLTDWTLKDVVAWRVERSFAETKYFSSPALPKLGAVDFEVECSGGLDSYQPVPKIFRVRASFTGSKAETLCTGILLHRVTQLVDAIEIRETKRSEQRQHAELRWLGDIALAVLR